MNRALIVVAVLLVIAAAVGIYWYQTPDARPGWVNEQVPIAADAEVVVYRWQDADGQWHLSGEPPPAGTPYETVRYRHDTNVLPPVQTERDDD